MEPIPSSEVKITNMIEPDLEGSSDSEVVEAAYQPNKTSFVLNPLNRDKALPPHLQPPPPAPYSPPPPPLQRPQTQYASSNQQPQPYQQQQPQQAPPLNYQPTASYNQSAASYNQPAPVYQEMHSPIANKRTSLMEEPSPQRQPMSTQELMSSPMRKKESSSPLKRGDTMGSGSELSSPMRLNKKVKKGYEMASFNKAIEFKDSQSYRKRNDEGDYLPMQTCGENSELKEFGLGIYLYFEFIKRLGVALLLIATVNIFPIVANYHGTGLDKYSSESFTTTLARLSLGNTANGDRNDYLIQTVSDIVGTVILILFWIHWRSFHSSVLHEMEKDYKIINPVRYVVAVEDFSDERTNTRTLQSELRTYIDALYKGAFEVEVVYNYNGNFNNFINYEQLIEKVEKEVQVIKQTGKDTEKLAEMEKDLEKAEAELKTMSSTFQPMYALIHFRTLKAKIAFLNHCRHFKLTNSFGQGCLRALCCTPHPPERTLFQGRFSPMLKNTRISRPEEINWNNMDMTGVARFVRGVFSVLFVAICIAITSGLIGLCTLYVASSSNCQNYVTPTGTVAQQVAVVQARNSESDTFCYCNANLALIYTDAAVGGLCGSISNKVLMTNAIQIGASIVSAVTNVLLAIITAVIAKYLLRPANIPKEYTFIFWGVLLSSFINTAVIPLLLNGNVFGMEMYTYLKFINFIDFSKLSIFSDFTTDWYALIAPYYLNFMIIGCLLSPFIGLVVFSVKHCVKMWRLRSKCEDNDKDDPLIQKEANHSLLSLQFLYPEETAMVLVLVLIGLLYSGLIPLMVPILAAGMLWIYICKRTIVVKYSVKIPADQTVNQSVINFFPFIILFHCCFSIWSHTTPGVFASGSSLVTLNLSIFKSDLDRIFRDALILGQGVLVCALIILDYTLVSFVGWLQGCCKDEMDVPVEWAPIENHSYSDRIQKTNILGSYKMANHPVYGHVIKAYNELVHRKGDLEDTKEALDPNLGLQ